MCGEKAVDVVGDVQVKGSPPRVRGKGCKAVAVLTLTRITPACAGKSGSARLLISSCWDHPRVCGEKHQRRKDSINVIGSPPRVRGKAKKVKKRYIISRITPACAGKRISHILHTVFTEDHPRVCGEKKRAKKIGT